MATDATCELIWYHKPFGRRVAHRGSPFFTICRPAQPDDDDRRRRNELAALAGL